MRRILANHVATGIKRRAGKLLLPINYAIGVDGGMDFVIKATQLSIEKYIQVPQAEGTSPTRAAIFLDLKNMFNNILRERLMHIIAERFPELINIANLFYASPGKVHYRWDDGSWRTISMMEGVTQGCPLSCLFAALVLDSVLRPIDTHLRLRAQARLLRGDVGDDGYGSITHILAFVDDASTVIPHEDLQAFFDKFMELAPVEGC